MGRVHWRIVIRTLRATRWVRTVGVGSLAALVVATLAALAPPSLLDAVAAPTTTTTSTTSTSTSTTSSTTTSTSTTSTTRPPGPTLPTLPPTSTTIAGGPQDPVAQQFTDEQLRQLYESLDGGGDARSGFYASQAPFDPLAANAVLSDQLAKAQADVVTAKRAEQLAAADYELARTDLASLVAEYGTLDQDYRNAVEEAARAKQAFNEKVLTSYIQGNDKQVSVLLGAQSATDYASHRTLLDSVLTDQHATIDDYLRVKNQLDDEARHKGDRLASARQRLLDSAETMRKATFTRWAGEFAVRAYAAGSHVAISGFQFPVLGEVQFVDSFGAPRNVNTPDAHWHEGIDIMAPLGTPVVAMEDGVILGASANRLGGNSIRLRGVSGNWYYGAHLVAYAPGITAGVQVKGGDIIGFVGNTGDASGGPTHLHFEIHLPDDSVVNPYPLLRVTYDTEPHRQPPPGLPTFTASAGGAPDGASGSTAVTPPATNATATEPAATAPSPPP